MSISKRPVRARKRPGTANIKTAGQKKKHEKFDIIIIGAGVAGLAGAMYAGRMRMKTLVIGDIPVGGTITLTNVVENYPGFKRLTGMELADRIKEHALAYPVKLEEDAVIKIEKCLPDGYTVYTKSKNIFHSKTLLFATGTKHRELGIPGEKEFTNRGVQTCALCDGPVYKGKVVCVVGGSDSAAKEALLLTQWAKKVFIIYRGEKIRPEPINGMRVEEKIREGKIEIISNTNLKEIKGDKRVRSVALSKPYKNRNELALDGVFVEIGAIPLSDLAKKLGVAINEKEEIMIDRNAETNMPGVYAAGDVTDTRFKQAITGVAEAVLAVYSSYTYISGHNIVCACDDETISG